MSNGRRVETTSTTWQQVLAHREPGQIQEIAARFEQAGVQPQLVAQAIADGGAQLDAAMRSNTPGWEQPFGGLLAVALLAGEIAAHSAYLVSRASAVRAVAVDGLLEDFSAIAVGASLGVSRQKVYEIGRNGQRVRAEGGLGGS